jgi:hypothetical protein
MQPEVARVGDGGLAPQDIGHSTKDGMVHRMGTDFETQAESHSSREIPTAFKSP